MTGDVSNEDTEVLVIDTNEIIEIPGDRGHRKETGRDIEPGELRERVRKDRELNLAGHFEFVVESEKLFGELSASFAKKNVAVDTSFDDRRREGFVDVVYRPYLEPVGFVVGACLASQETDRDFARCGIRLESGANFVAVHFGHHDVKKDKVRFVFSGGQSESFLAIRGDLCLIGIPERAGDSANVGRSVVDNEDQLLGCRSWMRIGRHNLLQTQRQASSDAGK